MSQQCIIHFHPQHVPFALFCLYARPLVAQPLVANATYGPRSSRSPLRISLRMAYAAAIPVHRPPLPGTQDQQFREIIAVIGELAQDLRGIVPFIDEIYLNTSRRQRIFLASFGAIGQGDGDWGIDMTNVVYSTAWHYLLTETGRKLWLRGVASLNSSGNIIEMMFGLMYLSDKMPQMTCEAFLQLCEERQFAHFQDIWIPTYKFLLRQPVDLATLSNWRFILLDFVLAWRSLLRAKSSVLFLFEPWTTNATWDPKRILSITECLRMGWPADADLLNAFFHHPLPPPSATCSAEAIQTYCSIANGSSTFGEGEVALIVEAQLGPARGCADPSRCLACTFPF
jgi:hypothetical protein